MLELHEPLRRTFMSNVRVLVRQLVNTLRATYSTIDVRTAAVLDRRKWVNVYTAIRLTYERPSVASQQLERLQAENSPVQTRHFKILMEAFSFSAWERICNDLASAKIYVGGVSVVLGEGFNLMDE